MADDAMNPTPEPATACTAFGDRIQRVLDGDADSHALTADPHLRDCDDCRSLAAAAADLLAGLAVRVGEPAVPSALADLTVYAAVADYRRRVWVRRAGRAAVVGLAAGLLVVVWAGAGGAFGGRNPEVVTPSVRPDSNGPAGVTPVRPVALSRQLAAAGDAVVSLTRKATDSTVSSARRLIPDPPPRAVDSRPISRTLSDLPAAARTGFEPVADTARRAFGRFVRDFESVAGVPKMKS